MTKLARTQIPDFWIGESIEAMADAVLGQAPSQFALAGFSMGGLVALEVLARVPERVCRLALLSTNTSGLLPPVRRHLQDSIAVIEAGGLDDYLLDAFPLYIAPRRAHDHALLEVFSDMAKRVGLVVGVRQMRALLDYVGFQHELGRISCPTTVICGDDRQQIGSGSLSWFHHVWLVSCGHPIKDQRPRRSRFNHACTAVFRPISARELVSSLESEFVEEIECQLAQQLPRSVQPFSGKGQL